MCSYQIESFTAQGLTLPDKILLYLELILSQFCHWALMAQLVRQRNMLVNQIGFLTLKREKTSFHLLHGLKEFSNLSCMFLNPNIFFQLSNILDMRNLQEQVKKSILLPKIVLTFYCLKCSSDLKNFANSRPSAWNFESFSQSLEQFFLTVGQDNVGKKNTIPLTGKFQIF